MAFTQVLGTAPTLAVLPQLTQDNIIAAPASLDAFWVREQNLLPVGGPYQIQAINALDYYINEADGKGKNICSIIQDDAYGEAGQSGVDFAAEKLGFEVADTQKFKVGDKDVTGQVQRLAALQVRRGVPRRHADRRGHDLGHRRQARLRAALDRPVADVDRRARRLAAGRVPQADDVDRRRGHRVGRRQRAGHGRHGRARRGVQARPGAGLLLRVRLQPGRRDDRAAREGGRARRPLARGDHEGVRGARARSSFDGLSGDYQYGPAEERNPPRTSTIFEVDPEKPFGLGTLEYQYESEAAK